MHVSGPIAGPITLGQGTFDQVPNGYRIEEYFVSGRARSFAAGGDGQVAAVDSAPFTTRMVIARPADAARFNGTVAVEWLNVSGGTDAAPDWTYLHRELVREGYAYAGVSAQRGGLTGTGSGIPGVIAVMQADPARYAAIDHPGDAFGFDIYAQCACAAAALPNLEAARILALGESQSAAFLTTFANVIDPLLPVFDGYLIHSRFRGAVPLDGSYVLGAALAIPAGDDGACIRSDVRVPVLTFVSETDLLAPGIGYLPARQLDAANICTWEVAGTAHADTYTMFGAAIDTGSAAVEELAMAFEPLESLFGQALAKPINAAPQHHYAMQAALAALDGWARTGTGPAPAPRLDIAGSPAALVPDPAGNATGGVRSPWMDVPLDRFSGFGQSGGGFITLFGSTERLDSALLEQLYPGGIADYLDRFAIATDVAICSGWLRPSDRAEIMALATRRAAKRFSAL